LAADERRTGERRKGGDRRTLADRFVPSGARWPFVAAGVALAALLGWLSWFGLARRSPSREGAPGWSPDGRRVVYTAEIDGHADLFVMNADGTNANPLVETAGVDEGAPAFAPDGRHIAFDRTTGGNADIWVCDAAGELPRQLTADPARDLAPAWSPDSRRIAFISDRFARPAFDVLVMNADGSHVERLTTKDSNWSPQFSPDGARLAFHAASAIRIFDFATRTLTPLTAGSGNGMSPTWSPDGRRLAFVTSRNGRMEIFVMNADGGDAHPVVTPPSGSAIDPRWSPDGSRIVFVQVSDTDPQTPSARQSRAIYTVELESGRVTRLSR
jgi:TolB protein